jgi:hypothetical protein
MQIQAHPGLSFPQESAHRELIAEDVSDLIQVGYDIANVSGSGGFVADWHLSLPCSSRRLLRRDLPALTSRQSPDKLPAHHALLIHKLQRPVTLVNVGVLFGPMLKRRDFTDDELPPARRWEWWTGGDVARGFHGPDRRSFYLTIGSRLAGPRRGGELGLAFAGFDYG